MKAGVSLYGRLNFLLRWRQTAMIPSQGFAKVFACPGKLPGKWQRLFYERR